MSSSTWRCSCGSPSPVPARCRWIAGCSSGSARGERVLARESVHITAGRNKIAAAPVCSCDRGSWARPVNTYSLHLRTIQMHKNSTGVAVATAAAMLFGFAAAASAADAPAAAPATVHCHGVNACKGQSACKSANNSCKGQNSCKGKGFLEMTQEECKDAQQKIRELLQGK